MRLARTVGVVLVIVVLFWSCSGSDESTSPTSTTTTTEKSVSSTTKVAQVALPTTANSASLNNGLGAARSQTAAAALGSEIIVPGGLDADLSSTATIWSFDPTTGKSSEFGELPNAVHDAAVAALDGAVFVFGGAKGNTVYGEVSKITPDGKVATVGRLPEPRTGATAVRSSDGTAIYIFGGFSGKDPMNDVLKTTDGSNFETVAELNAPARNAAVAIVGETAWVVGGEWEQAPLTAVQRVELATGTVTGVANLGTPLNRAVAFSLGGAVFVAGGRSGDSRTATIMRINPIDNTFTDVGKLPKALSDAAVAVIGDTAYVVGGATPTASAAVVAVTAA
ncbi:MAG: kelch repeat-containing protein [Microthrixaceae bacterium]